MVTFWIATLIATLVIFGIVWAFYQSAQKGKTSWSEVFWIAIAGNYGLWYLITMVAEKLGWQ